MQQKQSFAGHRSNRKILLSKVTLIDPFTTGLLGIHNHSYKSLVSHINYQETIYKSLYIRRYHSLFRFTTPLTTTMLLSHQ